MPIQLLLANLLCNVVLSGSPAPVSIVIENDPTPVQQADLQLTPTPPAESRQSVSVEPSVRRQQDEVLASLRVQAVLREARQLVESGQFAKAIAMLEEGLPCAEGCTRYLETLERAYRGEMARLLFEKKADEARLLADRLCILAPKQVAGTVVTAAAEASAHWQKTAAGPLVQSVLQAASHSAAADSPPPEPSYEARAKLDEETPAAGGFARVFADAEQLFAQEHYAEALSSYERAYELDPTRVQTGRERWGYCLLWTVYQRYNQMAENAAVTEADLADLESDLSLATRLATSLKPIVEKDNVAANIAALRQWHQQARAVAAVPAASTSGENRYIGSSLQSTPQPQSVPRQHRFQHLPGRSQSWSVLQSDNFFIYHRDPRLAEEVAQLAEDARQRSFNQWFSDQPMPAWSPRCEIYLYPTAHEYSQTTGVPAQSPGHSKVLNDNGRIRSRKVELRVDDPNMKYAILPHEITHVVLADGFAPFTVPRWADEGMAVLTEPRAKQEAHLANLARLRQTSGRYSCAQVMTMREYPPGHRMRDFYAHSVGISRFLVEKYGARRLTQFVRTALQTGSYELALQQVYGTSTFAMLESGFEGYVASLQTGNQGLVTASLNR